MSINKDLGINIYSKSVTQNDTQPAAQAMLHAIGLSDRDLQNPIVGIASTEIGRAHV